MAKCVVCGRLSVFTAKRDDEDSSITFKCKDCEGRLRNMMEGE